MAERELVLYPPEILFVDSPLVFLAGPIQDAPVWQPQAARHIHERDPAITVASPRKDYEEGTFVYEHQVDWEAALLYQAGAGGVVSFWLSAPEKDEPRKRAFGQTTRIELGEWMVRHQYEGAPLTVGIEEGFGNERYIRRRLSQECPDVKITDNLEEMCQDAVDLANRQPRIAGRNLAIRWALAGLRPTPHGIPLT